MALAIDLCKWATCTIERKLILFFLLLPFAWDLVGYLRKSPLAPPVTAMGSAALVAGCKMINAVKLSLAYIFSCMHSLLMRLVSAVLIVIYKTISMVSLVRSGLMCVLSCSRRLICEGLPKVITSTSMTTIMAYFVLVGASKKLSRFALVASALAWTVVKHVLPGFLDQLGVFLAFVYITIWDPLANFVYPVARHIPSILNAAIEYTIGLFGLAAGLAIDQLQELYWYLFPFPEQYPPIGRYNKMSMVYENWCELWWRERLPFLARLWYGPIPTPCGIWPEECCINVVVWGQLNAQQRKRVLYWREVAKHYKTNRWGALCTDASHGHCFPGCWSWPFPEDEDFDDE